MKKHESRSAKLEKMSSKQQESAAYEAILDALAFVSCRDEKDDDKHVNEHVLDSLSEAGEETPIPHVIADTIHVCDDFKSISAEFMIKGKRQLISTDPPSKQMAA